MNSHATSINLQSSGQTVVVGHHRGYSQPSSTNSGDPWFLQSTAHPAPPTAPARQHKRPAPQPTGQSIQHSTSNLLQPSQQSIQLQLQPQQNATNIVSLIFFLLNLNYKNVTNIN